MSSKPDDLCKSSVEVLRSVARHYQHRNLRTPTCGFCTDICNTSIVISTMSNKQFAQEGLLSTEYVTTPHHNRFTALFPGPSGWAGARRKLLDFMVQGKINRGRHTDHLAGRHSIQSGLTSAYLTIPPYFLQAGCPSCRPTNSVEALKVNRLTAL